MSNATVTPIGKMNNTYFCCTIGWIKISQFQYVCFVMLVGMGYRCLPLSPPFLIAKEVLLLQYDRIHRHIEGSNFLAHLDRLSGLLTEYEPLPYVHVYTHSITHHIVSIVWFVLPSTMKIENFPKFSVYMLCILEKIEGRNLLNLCDDILS